MRGLLAIVALAFCPCAAWAGLAVSANDGKQILQGEAAGLTPDSVSILDLSVYPPKVIGSVSVPAAMIGPPDAVAVTADENFAIVTAAQKTDPADPYNPAADDTVSVIDLRNPQSPRLRQTVTAGAGASGVSINRAGTLVLVAAKGANAIYAFTLADGRLAPAGKVDLSPGAAPTDVVFAPDGRHAYAVAWGVTKIMELAVVGARVSRTGNDVATGRQPYGAVVTPDGRWLINTNVGGALVGPDHSGTVTVVDLARHSLAVSLPVGKVPEHVTLSPDGKYLALVLANGAATTASAPSYDSVLGILKIFAVNGGSLTQVAHADSCHWNQGAAWSDDGHLLLAQCAQERTIQVFRFDGRTLTLDPSATMRFQSRPGAIATRLSR